MDSQLKRYLRISFINLSIVAAIGSVLRYKIVYSLPFINQKYLLHAHSHFAFAGWITQTLMVFMVHYLQKQSHQDEFERYKLYLIANLIAAYGMLLFFPVQGYGVFSITFSTMSVFVSYFFAYRYWKELNLLKEQSIIHKWFKFALFLSVISSLGTFGLAYMMVNKIAHQTWYLAAIYYYLHFQYNGWFFFAGVGLLYFLLPAEISNQKIHNRIFLLFALSCIPAYFLSTLWLPLPMWLFVIIIIASFAQFYAWILMLKSFYENKAIIAKRLSTPSKWLLLLSGFALSIKLSLQLGSTIPSLSKLAFGFRPIVIAYLHLVLLGVITLFLLGYIFSSTGVSIRKLMLTGLSIFTAGIFLNEAALMVQGVASFSYTAIPFINQLLLLIALTMFSGILIMVISIFRD